MATNRPFSPAAREMRRAFRMLGALTAGALAVTGCSSDAATGTGSNEVGGNGSNEVGGNGSNEVGGNGAATSAAGAIGGAPRGTGGTSGTTGTAGAQAVGGAIASAGASATTTFPTPPRICEEPSPWPTPTSHHVVGTGTADSCTAAALSAAIADGGYVTFDCGTEPVTITLASAIRNTKTTIVDGEGKITLDGGGSVPIFVVASNSAMSVRNLRFIDGKAPEETEAAGIGGAVSGNWRSKVEVIGCTFEGNKAARGGGAVGVWTGSSLTIVSSRFSRNESWYGGAVYSLLSPLTIVNSAFVDNATHLQSGFGDGGAIGTDGASESPNDSLGGTIEICGTEIRNNRGNGSGGGAYLWMYPPDKAIIDRTTVANNEVVKNAANQGAIGGAMRISNGEITIKDSSFLSNTSIGNGGGLYLDCAPSCAIANSTFFANKNTAGWGGAIFSGTPSGTFNIANATFANNAQQGTSPNAFFGTATWKIKNSIFLDNGCANTGTGEKVLQWSTATKNAGSGPCVSSVIAKDPVLSLPANQGGPTDTMLPGPGSGALQAGVACEATDQRGQARDVSACDLGSVEVP